MRCRWLFSGLLASFLVLSLSQPASARKRVRAFTPEELEKMAASVYNQTQNNYDGATDNINLLNSPAPAVATKKIDPLAKVQEALSADNPSVQEIYQSAVSAAPVVSPQTAQPSAPVVRKLTPPTVVQPTSPTSSSNRSNRLNAWVQRQSEPSVAVKTPEIPAPAGNSGIPEEFMPRTPQPMAASSAVSLPEPSPQPRRAFETKPSAAAGPDDILEQINRAAAIEAEQPRLPGSI